MIKFVTKNYVRSCSIFGVGGLSLDFGRLTCCLSVGRRGCLSVVAGALLLERCRCHAFQLAFLSFCSYGVFCVGMLSIHNSNRDNKSNSRTISTKEKVAWKMLGVSVWLLLLLSCCDASALTCSQELPGVAI